MEFKKRIKDWGLRHSTLEEVFMKVREFSLCKFYFLFRSQNRINKLKINCNYFTFLLYKIYFIFPEETLRVHNKFYLYDHFQAIGGKFQQNQSNQKTIL